MSSYAINLDAGSRVLSATFPEFAPLNSVLVDSLPEGDFYDYLYIDGEYIYDPLPEPEPEIVITDKDRFEAQLLYTALMTDTLLPEEET